MRDAKALDRLVNKEASELLAAARKLLESRKRRSPRHDELRAAADELSAALSRQDAIAVRRALPVLDGIVDELAEPVTKSVLREYTESISIAIVIALILRAFVIEAFKIPSASMYPTLEINDHIFVSKFIYGVRLPMSDKKIFQVRPPKRGEVAVFLWPCNHDRDYIKRIVALPGDSVEVRCNVLYVNGRSVAPSLIDPNDSFRDENGKSEEVLRYREQLGGLSFDTYQKPYDPVRGWAAEFPELRSSSESPDCSGQEGVDPNRPPQVLGTIVKAAKPDPTDRCAQQLHYIVPPGHVFGMGDDRWNSNDSRKWGAIPINNLKGKAMFIWLSYDDLGGSLRGIRWSRMGNFVH